MTAHPPRSFSRVCFHAACTVVLLTGIAHSIAQFMSNKPPANDQERQVTDALAIKLPGINRSLGDIFAGFGHHYSLSLFLFAALGWVILRWARSDPSLYRALCAILLFASLAFTINSFLHFFIIPNTFHVVATLFFIAAFMLAPKSIAQESAR